MISHTLCILNILLVIASPSRRDPHNHSVIKGAVDKNQYDHYVLKNAIPVLIVRNPLFKNSLCGLSVRTGFYDDPLEITGLAHFLEHMIFMGSKKYPSENEFRNFVNMHNGRCNAGTNSEHTTYLFEIDSAHFKKALDIFAYFFISPLFNRNSVNREINAVHSEYLNTMNAPVWREHAMLCELARPGEHMSRFGCGNDKTLKKDEVLEAVKEFWNTKYSSDVMTLVVCGNASLEELKRMLEVFEGIPNKHLFESKIRRFLPEIKNVTPEIFKEENVGKITHYNTQDDKMELTIFNSLPSLRYAFRTNPLRYLEELLKQKDDGSLIARLKEWNLASSLTVSTEYMENSTNFSIKIALTPNGFESYESVISIVHEYLLGLEANKCDYERQKKLSHTDFNYMQKKTLMEMVFNLATAMHFYPIENIMNFEYIYDHYDANLINRCISSIADAKKWIVLLTDPRKDATYEEKESYYGIHYGIHGEYKGYSGDKPHRASEKTRCSDDFLENIKVIKAPNRYLKRHEYPNGEVNLVFDSDFNMPKVYIYMVFSSLRVKQNPVVYELYFDTLIAMFLQKYARKVRNAHVNLAVESHPEGILIKINGFSQKITEITELFIKSISEWTMLSADMTDELRVPQIKFDLVKKETMNFYIDLTAQSPFRNLERTYGYAAASLMSLEETINQIKIMKVDLIRFKRYFFCKILAVGNIEFNKLENLFETISKEYLKDKKPVAHVPFSVEQSERIRVPTSDLFNTAVGVYYFININRGKVSYGDHEKTDDSTVTSHDPYDFNTAVGRLIWQIGKDKFFNELRTKEQIGYVVINKIHSFLTAQYLSFTVQSEQTIEFLEQRIQSFIEGLKTEIQQISAKTFEVHRKSVIGFYTLPESSLEKFSDMIFDQWRRGKIDLNYEKKMINLVKRLTVEDLLDSDIWKMYGVAYSSQE